MRAKDDWDLADERGEKSPRVDELSDAAVAVIRARLEGQLGTLTSGVGELERKPEAGATPQYGKRIGDHTSDAVETRRNVIAADALKLQQTEVRRALLKLDEGSYGICDACGRQIDEERLEALPWACACVACRTKRGRRVW